MKKTYLLLIALSSSCWGISGYPVQPIVNPGQIVFGSNFKTITSTPSLTYSSTTDTVDLTNIIINGTCTGSGCGSGGGGSSSIEVMANGIRVSSPTVTLSVLGNASTIITGTLVSGPTAQVTVVVSPSSGTLQGNTFNGTRQLIQTDSSGHLPALSGVNLTNLTGANVGSGVPAANIASGILGASVQASSVATNSVGVQQMNFGAGASASTFARGDGTWAVPVAGGGASTLAVQKSAVNVSSPTVAINFVDPFNVSLVNGSTSQVSLQLISLSTAVTGTLQAAQEPAHTGDVTNSGGSLAMTAASTQANIRIFTAPITMVSSLTASSESVSTLTITSNGGTPSTFLTNYFTPTIGLPHDGTLYEHLQIDSNAISTAFLIDASSSPESDAGATKSFMTLEPGSFTNQVAEFGVGGGVSGSTVVLVVGGNGGGISLNGRITAALNISSTVILSGSYGTSGQVFTSNGPGVLPTWTTVSGTGGAGYALQPATVTINANFGLTVSTLTVSSNTVLSGATFYQNGPINFSSPLSLGSNQIHLVTDPTSAQDAATKNYVDSTVNGIDYKPAAYLATTGALPANLYNNGASGVGATLTGVSVGALTIDNQAVSTTNRILVKNEVDQVNNGIYSVTTVGSGIAAYVLTRSVDYNQSSEITAGDAVFVTSGTANTSTGWVMTNAGFTTIGVSTITWSQFTGGGGSGITALTGDVTAAGTGSVAATAAANQPNITTLSSVAGVSVTNNLSAGSLQLQSASGNTILNSGNTFEIEPSTYLYLSVSTTTAVTSLNPFGGLSFAIAANETWEFNCMMAIQGATGGHKFGINGPSGATVQAIAYGTSSSATSMFANGITALNTPNTSSFGSVAASIMAKIEGTMANGSTAGSWQLLRESASGGDSVTISSGSYCDATRISP